MTAPIFVDVNEAAKMLGLSKWTIYELLNKQIVESRYHGTKRLVLVASLEEYAASLPASPPEKAPTG